MFFLRCVYFILFILLYCMCVFLQESFSKVEFRHMNLISASMVSIYVVVFVNYLLIMTDHKMFVCIL